MTRAGGGRGAAPVDAGLRRGGGGQRSVRACWRRCATAATTWRRAGNVGGGMSAIQFDADGTMTGAACWRADGTPIGLGGGYARKGVRFRPEAPPSGSGVGLRRKPRALWVRRNPGPRSLCTPYATNVRQRLAAKWAVKPFIAVDVSPVNGGRASRSNRGSNHANPRLIGAVVGQRKRLTAIWRSMARRRRLVVSAGRSPPCANTSPQNSV